MKKILILWLAHRNWDSRIFYKQAISLSKSFDVKCIWWIFSSKKWYWKEDKIKNIGITWNRIIVLFKSWLYWIKNKSDIYVAHDIDSYLVVLFIKLFRWKSKIIFDSHEYYDLYDKSKCSKIELFLLFLFSKIIKKITLKLFSWVTVTTEDMKNFYNITNKELIYNYPLTKGFDKIKANDKLSEWYLYFIYHWWISQDRWIFKMIDIFSKYKKINKNIKFLLIWTFSNKELELNVMSTLKNKWLKDDFIITWQLSLVNTISYLKNDIKKIWFCLFDNVWQISKSIPIKMYEYLYLEIPQIGSSFISSYKESIINNQCGLWVKFNDIEEQILAVKEINSNYDGFVKKCKLIKYDYTWKKEEIKLLEFYKNI